MRTTDRGGRARLVGVALFVAGMTMGMGPGAVGAQGAARDDDVRPDWSPDGHSIAFESVRDGNAEIYVLDLDHGAVRRLTDHLGQDVEPAWSPDGTRIVFASDRTRNAYSGRAAHQLYVMDADGSNVRRLTESDAADFMPAWSPDGRWIAFLSDRAGSIGLWLMPAEGGEARSLLPDDFPGEAGNPSWAPDSRRIAFDADVGVGYDILTVDITTSEIVNVTRSDGPEWWFPAWSPDGRTIAAGVFTGDARSGEHQIVAIDLESGRRTPLTPRRPRGTRDWDFWQRWSPDGTRLVFSSRRDGRWGLRVVGADGTGEGPLETRPGTPSPAGYMTDRSRSSRTHAVKVPGVTLAQTASTPTTGSPSSS